MLVVLFDAEVRGGEQLLQQDHLGPLGGSLANQLFGAVEVARQVPATRHLGGGDAQPAHGCTSGCCWVMQWMPPPP
ncbi:hypothetical protein D3C74_443200 [compost metagenome]